MQIIKSYQNRAFNFIRITKRTSKTHFLLNETSLKSKQMKVDANVKILKI